VGRQRHGNFIEPVSVLCMSGPADLALHPWNFQAAFLGTNKKPQPAANQLKASQ
jgi:hypothetical protein